jgi:hypothetical protein
MAKANMFKNATAPAKEEAAPKGTTWTVDILDLAEAVRQVNLLAAEIVRTTTLFKENTAAVKTYAEKRWLAHWASFRQQPETPVKVTTKAGDSVAFVVADKTRGFAPNAKMIAELGDLVGAVTLDGHLNPAVTYSFNDEVLALEAKDPMTSRKSTIMAMIARRINPLLEELVNSGQITRSQADALVSAEQVRVFDASFVAELPELCNRDPVRLGAAVTALGGAIVRFIKPA